MGCPSVDRRHTCEALLEGKIRGHIHLRHRHRLHVDLDVLPDAHIGSQRECDARRLDNHLLPDVEVLLSAT